jgi:hypothetical protein
MTRATLRGAALAAAALATVGCNGATGVVLTVDGPGLFADELSVVAHYGDTAVVRDAKTPKPVALPTEVFADLPTNAGLVTFDVLGLLGGAPVGSGTSQAVMVRAHSVAHATVALGPSGSDGGCAAASADCWDVQATFTAANYPADPTTVLAFGQPATVGQPVYAFLAGPGDNTYQDALRACSGRKVATGWFIERKPLAAGKWQVTVRGESAADCGMNPLAFSSGTLTVNAAAGWRVAVDNGCTVSSDAHNRSTSCVVDGATGTVTWAGGSPCGTCCNCDSAGQVNIDITVARVATP